MTKRSGWQERIIPKVSLTGSRTKRWITRSLGLLCVLTAFSLQLTKPAVFEQAGNLLFDSYQQWHPRIYHADIPVRVIDIDNKSIDAIGQWPWSRLTLASLNDRLTEAGAAVIAYDVIFSEADRTSPDSLRDILARNPSGTFDPNMLEGLADHDAIFSESLARSPSVLGFFMLREPSARGPQTAPGIVTLGDSLTELQRFEGTLPALPEFGQAASGEGFVSFLPDGDGIVREAPLFYQLEQAGRDPAIYGSLSMEALRVVQGASTYQLTSASKSNGLGIGSRFAGAMTGARVGDFQFPTGPEGRFRIYYTPATADLQESRTLSAKTILDPSIPISDWADRVAGNIVFIGSSADGLKDLVATPMAPAYEGVAAHAQIAEQIIGEAIHGDQIIRRPYWTIAVERGVLLIAGLILVFALPRLGAAMGALISAALLSGLFGFSLYQFTQNLILVDPIYPGVAIAGTYLIMTIANLYLTEAQRSQIRGAFSRYLSPEMVRQVSEDPSQLSLGGQERPMTILFLDVRSFSKISETMTPQDIVTFLNLFLTPMTDALQAHGATIDKYIGDAIVAFWNAPIDDPDHERNACRAVLAMSAALRDLRAKYEAQEAVKWPENLAMGIGLNTGICCVGNLGAEQRFSYSMIGDAANLASRIEGLTKQYRVETLIGDSTADAAKTFALLDADLIRVIGRQAPERVWILVGDEDVAKSEAFRAIKSNHDQMRAAYAAKDWDAADTHLAKLREAGSELGLSGYYDVITERIAAFRTNPPAADWDGVFIATSK